MALLSAQKRTLLNSRNSHRATSKSSGLNRVFEFQQEKTENSYSFPSIEPNDSPSQSFTGASAHRLGWHRDNRDFLAEFVFAETLHSQYLNMRYSVYLDYGIRMDEASADSGADDVMSGQIHHLRRS